MSASPSALEGVTQQPSSTRSPRRASLSRSLRTVENVVLIILLALVAVAAVAVGTGNWQARTVLTGSMRPHLPVGSIVLSQRVPLNQLNVGDIAVFHRPDQPELLVVHRIIAIRTTAAGTQVRTKGDANNVADAWNPFILRGPDVYIARHDLPYLGYVVTAARGNHMRLVFFVAAGLLALAAVRHARRPERLRPTRHRRHHADVTIPPRTLASVAAETKRSTDHLRAHTRSKSFTA